VRNVLTARYRRARRFHDDIESRRPRQGPRDRREAWATELYGGTENVKVPVYKHLLDLNAGFDQVIHALAALRKHDAFLAREVVRYSDFAKEVRAATNSYLMSELERVETREAGRRFGRRWEREQREE
jgi:hypothetical protein